jgi:hypothetical protein
MVTAFRLQFRPQTFLQVESPKIIESAISISAAEHEQGSGVRDCQTGVGSPCWTWLLTDLVVKDK